ncbi:MAG: type II toxin-antitoxin system HicB family antitoxin [Lachnospiraceae bacterium]|nr:type II toxin-antitoxin system HicB family antitoxin [Lachnospiraceae bacterium]
MSENYTYAAVFDYSENGCISIHFPMFDGTATCVEEGDDPVKAAQEVLTLAIEEYESTGRELPGQDVIPKVTEKQRVVFINVWMPYFRSLTKVIYTKKTLTIPVWLDMLAKERNVNYSAILVKGLKKELGIPE